MFVVNFKKHFCLTLKLTMLTKPLQKNTNNIKKEISTKKCTYKQTKKNNKKKIKSKQLTLKQMFGSKFSIFIKKKINLNIYLIIWYI